MQGQSWTRLGRTFPLHRVFFASVVSTLSLYILLSDMTHVKTEINSGSMHWELSFALIGLLSLKLKYPPPAFIMEGVKHIKELSDTELYQDNGQRKAVHGLYIVSVICKALEQLLG